MTEYGANRTGGERAGRTDRSDATVAPPGRRSGYVGTAAYSRAALAGLYRSAQVASSRRCTTASTSSPGICRGAGPRKKSRRPASSSKFAGAAQSSTAPSSINPHGAEGVAAGAQGRAGHAARRAQDRTRASSISADHDVEPLGSALSHARSGRPGVAGIVEGLAFLCSRTT